MDKLRQDIGYSLRTMRHNPLVTVVIVLTLAIGIGASTAIFTLVDAVLLRDLPYRDPDRLVAVWLRLNSQPDAKAFATYRDFLEIREHAESFEDVAANTWAFAGQTLMWRGEPHRVLAIPSTENLFSLLGASAARGRTFAPGDLARGCSVVLSDRFWRARLGGDEDVIGRGIMLDGEACDVVGVMPAGFEFFPKATDVWTLILPTGPFAQDPVRGVAIFARLRPGVSHEAATAEVEALHEQVGEALPPGNFTRDTTLAVYGLQDELTFLAGANLRLALLMLSAAVAMVLLICCLNVAGVLLGRGAERQKELALRAALGSDRRRIVRQLLTESVVLAALGAGLGALLAELAVRGFRAVSPIDLPPGSTVEVNGAVLAFTATVGIAAALVFGLVPSLKVSRVDLNSVIKGAGARVRRSALPGAAGVRGRALRGNAGKLFVVLEIALSMVLLSGAALLLQSIHRLTSVPLSFRTDDLMLGTVTLPAEDSGENAQRSRFYDAFLERVSALPGVEGAALSTRQPLSGQIGGAVTIAGKPPPTNELGDVDAETVSPSFMDVMSIALLRGRGFDARDREGSTEAAIVNQRFVDEYLADREPLGARIKLGLDTDEHPWLTIVGVVANAERTNYFSEMSFATQPIVYRPLAQQAERTMTLLIRAGNDVRNLGALLQREAESLDPRVPVYGVESMDDVLSRTFAQPRLRTRLLGGFAAVAVLLSAIGIYGLLMYSVVQRTREIGIRMALGADRRRVLRSIMGEGLALVAVGAASGLVMSAYLTRFIEKILYGSEGLDPAAMAAAAAILIGASLAATYLPARRAMRVDPFVALRAE